MTTEPHAIFEQPPAQQAGLRIYLLGPLRIERDGEARHLSRRKVEALLAYLLLHPEQHARDHLATLFWGDSTDSQARHSLRTAMAALRKELAPDLILADRNHLQLNREVACWVDLHELLSLSQGLEETPTDQFAASFAQWQGDLLSDFYEDWIGAERSYYHGQLSALALQVIQQLRTRSAYPQAIAIGQQLLSFDPTNEAAHQQLIFCYMAAGDRTAALHQYDLCERTLEAELDLPPSAETAALYHWIKAHEAEAAAPQAKITNLPIPLTSFVGRIMEMSTIKQLLNPTEGATRLLTLTGAGGSGKTRLAIQAATDLVDRYADGVWWVELAALTDGEQVARAVAKTLGITEAATEPLSETLANYLHNQQLLLVIDNCEHLVEPVAHLVDFLLSRCPQLQILTTSRVPLNISGETLWQVPTFSIPDPQQILLTELLLPYECVRLFVERATAVQPVFRLTLENATAVIEICRQLDGIPLAIELAAARVKVLSVEQIAAYLKSALGARFALLTQGSRAGLPRQQTLRAAIDWSYALLDDAERQLFQQLAIFRGGFTLEALEQVANADSTDRSIPAHQLLDLLTQLIDKSLVIVEQQGAQNRYRLLETLREYAREQYTTTAAFEQMQQRHATHFWGLAAQAEPELFGPHQQRWLTQLETEHPNLRAALAYLIAAVEGEMVLRMATALHRFWEYRGYVHEGREWLQKALAQRQRAAPRTIANALNAASALALRQSDYAQARPLLEEGRVLFEQLKEEIGLAETWQKLAIVEMHQGQYTTAQQLLQQSLDLCRTLGDTFGIARSLNLLGNLAWEQDTLSAAYAYYVESLRLHQSVGDQVSIAVGFLNVGSMELQRGAVAAAHTNCQACLRIGHAIGHQGVTAMALKSLSWIAFAQQAYAQAQSYGEEALAIFQRLGDKNHIGQTLGALGDVMVKLGKPEAALAYYCQNVQTVHQSGHHRALFAALEDIAHLLSAVDRKHETAVRLLGAAARLRQTLTVAVAPNQQADYEQRIATLRQRLDDEIFAMLWTQGETAPLDTIVTEALHLSLDAM